MASRDFRGAAYVKGSASGQLLTSDLELSFWGGVDPQSGQIIDHHHPLCGQHLQGMVLAIPGGRGSCSGSGVVLELLLNDNGPKAIIFERREDILTLGVMIAEEVFGKAIPVVSLDANDFKKILSLNGHQVHIFHDQVCFNQVPPEGAVDAYPSRELYPTSGVELSDADKEFLQGLHGEAARVSMRIVVRMAALLGARTLMDITQVHVDGCIYTGPGSLAFAERLRDWGGQVQVPTSLNSISIDQKRWVAQGVDSKFGEAAAKLAKAYTDMGARPTFTCAPYQLDTAPKFGDQIAWAESNAVVYANSVLGARTMKYPDFLDIAIALTGRAPRGGLHIAANRLASLVLRVSYVPSKDAIDDSFYPLLGYHVGTLSSSRIPVVVGMEALAPSVDDLKAFGAAFATVSSAPMFHIVGITPEAPALAAVLDSTHEVQCAEIDLKDLQQHWDQLNSASRHQAVDLVSLGNPHFSFAEIRKLVKLCHGRIKRKDVEVIVTCGRSTYGLASQAGLIGRLETFGVQFMTDTCWCMIQEPVIPRSKAAVVTNSAKYAHYGPGLTGRQFYFASLAGCVDAASQTKGRAKLMPPRWLLDSVKWVRS